MIEPPFDSGAHDNSCFRPSEGARCLPLARASPPAATHLPWPSLDGMSLDGMSLGGMSRHGMGFDAMDPRFRIGNEAMTIQKCLFVFVVSAICLFTATLSAHEIGSNVLVTVSRGDANGDGVLNRDDATLMHDILKGEVDPSVSIRDLDMDKDGHFTERDLLELRTEVNLFGEQRVHQETEFAILGDANDDGFVDLGDVVSLLQAHFQGVRYRAPAEVVDINLDGKFDLRDVIELTEIFFGKQT